MKDECTGCGATDYDGALGVCPFCKRSKCSFCDMGDDVPCGLCEEDSSCEDDG